MTVGSRIESIGVKLPAKSVSTAEILGRMKNAKPLKLELLTGISYRRVCSDNEDSLSLAVDAVFDCFNHSALKASDIEMIISCSISKYAHGLRHYYDPPFSSLIKHRTGCTNAQNFDITNACAGMMTGMHLANTLISRGVVRNCLIVSGEFITSISDNAERNVDSSRHPELASLTVGDAGAALLLTCTENSGEWLIASKMNTLSRYSDLCTAIQCTSFPGAAMKTEMMKIHEASISHAPDYVGEVLKKSGLSMHQIDYLIPHQTAKQSIDAGAASLVRHFREEPGEIVVNLHDTSNTASTTHITTLYKYLNEKRFKEGDKVMLLCFASGLVIGVIIFTMNDLIKKYGNHH